MIPFILKIRIPQRSKRGVTLYLPLFLLWILLLGLLLLLSPVILLIVLIAILAGRLRYLFITAMMFMAVLWHLRGLKLDIENNDNRIYFSFI